MNDLHDIELIVRCYEGTATEADQQQFAQKVADDPEFRLAAERHREAIQAMERLANRAELKKIFEEEDARLGPVNAPASIAVTVKRPRPGKGRLISLLAVAASLIGLLLWFLWNDPPARTPEQLFAEHFQPGQLRGNERKQGPLPSDPFERYLYYFEGQEYDSCQVLFPLLPDSVKTFPKVQLYQSAVLIKTGQDAAAVELLQNLINRNTLESLPARWFLALIRLRNGDVEACRNELEIIIASSSLKNDFQKHAQELLEQLAINN